MVINIEGYWSSIGEELLFLGASSKAFAITLANAKSCQYIAKGEFPFIGASFEAFAIVLVVNSSKYY